MCGIAGIILANSNKDQLKPIHKMCKSLHLRGPDGNGVYYGNRFALCHTRLAIQDISELAAQPMIDPQTGVVISFNGEIYNYKEMRDELVNIGISFSSSGDTEVLLAGYLAWGLDVLKRSVGMWSIVIWDPRKQEIILSRDRFGIKPLYISKDKNNNIVFGSTINSILASEMIDEDINNKAVKDYLLNGIVDHDHSTFYKNIFKFPEASIGIISLNSKVLKIKLKRFWKIEDFVSDNRKIKFRDEVSFFHNNLMNSLELHTRSDVEISSCLSGGMDSSSLVAGISLQSDKNKIKTFSAIFPDKPYDENRYSAALAKKYNLPRYTVSPNASDFIRDIDHVIKAQEEPFVSTGVYVQWKIFEQIKSKGIKVAIDGQGADEYLAGYLSFLIPFMLHCLKNLKIFPFIKSLKILVKHKIYLKILGGIKPTLFRLFNIRGIPLNSKFEGFINKDALDAEHLDDLLFADIKHDKVTGFKSILVRYLTKSSLPSLLRYEDRNSMYFSIESRVPFLDHRLVEQALQTNVFFLMDGQYTKKLLRESFAQYVPDIISKRTDKIGFGNPENEWVTSLIDSGKFEDLFADSSSSKYFNLERIKNLIRSPKTASDYNFLWRVYCFLAWNKIRTQDILQ